eukprot:CAMPEP_0181114234 /NCGR_PEP_ID=MMETSP1071-20121207/20768_1 /TAXON_ID=35127 /ORGANISM="Thalassiosira sp., Strain NH16" /LENGTH=725 /DNA_ID=CAMNT_0023198317 /DNA_START=143 /DNA_END=2318 /DNA_ORIENTATION=-
MKPDLSSLHHATIVSVILTAFALPASRAFSPAPTRRLFGVQGAIPKDNCVDFFDVLSCSRHHPSSSCLYASGDGTVNANSGDDDDEEDDEVDIITQKLRRNSENGPINPIKEHNKMVRENEDEAKNVEIGENKNITGAEAQSALYSYMLANTVHPDFDPDVSTDEAYVESQLKELLSRKGEALSRLGPGIATLPLDPSSDEAKSELDLSKKEVELQKVIDEMKSSSEKEWDESNLGESHKKQSDILEKAHKLQAEIDQLHVDDCGAVLIANLGFYEAFSLQDPEGMKNVWWQSPSVMCIHPSHPPLVGSNVIFESFKAMFDNGIKGRVRGGGDNSAASGGVFMTPANIRGLSVRGTTASLVCDEEVFSRGSAGENSLGGGILINKLLTTNVFRKIGGQWKMVHRHASWHPESTAAHEAMKVEPGIVMYDSKKDDAKSNATNKNQSKRSKGMTLRRLNGDGTSKRPLGISSIPSSLEGLDANAVLGIPMPKEEEPEKSSDAADGNIAKIINLSDLLGGNDSGGGKDDNDKGIGDALADMLMGSADSDNKQTTGSGTPEDPFITRRVIKIGPEGIENLAGKNNKKDSDDDDDVVIDLRDKSEEEKKEILSKLQLPSSVTDEVMKASAMDASNTQVRRPNDKEMIRQKCIATLRKLSGDGLLSSKQKRVLLTDIITSSAKGETSMVEVAFELLCESVSTDESELDTGMEDFTNNAECLHRWGRNNIDR